MNEQRRFSQFFDINYYRANNSDLGSLGYNGRQLLQHFETYGLNQGRQFSAAFNTKYYQSVNPDLASLNNQQLYDHFQINGLGEGRISSPVFDVSYYLAKNSDLVARGLTYETAYNHFVLYGFQEGRIAQLPAYDIRTPETIFGGFAGFADPNLGLESNAPNRKVQFNLVGNDNRRKIGSQTWVLVHGWNGSVERLTELAGAVSRAKPNDTVLVLDWRQAAWTSDKEAAGVLSGANYYAATWIRPVADYAQRALTRWGVDPSSLNFIGHSLGPYVASETAGLFVERNNGVKVNSITALDPASESNTVVTSNNTYDFDIRTDGSQRPRPNGTKKSRNACGLSSLQLLA